MKLSTQEEYGLRCLLHMAKCVDGGSLTIPEISRAEGLSVPNVAKLMRLLRIGGLVTSVRGQAGGYTLARDPETVKVSEVLRMLGGRFFNREFCERHTGRQDRCAHAVDCSLRVLWTRIQSVLDQVLDNTTLKDLLHSEDEMEQLLGASSASGPSPVGNNLPSHR